jgi:hypothetical protein
MQADAATIEEAAIPPEVAPISQDEPLSAVVAEGSPPKGWKESG